MHLRPALALAALAGLSLVASAPPVRADGVDDEIKAFEEYLATKPDSQGIRNRIADISQKKDPRIAKLLMPMVRNPKYDDEVRITAMQNVGRQGDKAVGTQLLALADSKPFEEKPKLIAAAYEGAGDADPKGNSKELLKAVRTWMPKNGDVACAAIRGASLHNTRETVDDFLKFLADADYVTTADSAVKRDAKGKAKAELLSCLKKMTGEQINDIKAWQEWWGRVKKTWEPPAAGGDGKTKDLNASETYVDDAYGFKIKRPNKAWTLRKSDDGTPYLTYEALDEGQRAAWVDMFVYGTKGIVQNTPALKAKQEREGLEAKFKDLKEAEWERKCVYGGQSGVEQILKGRHKDLDAISMHNVYVDKSGIMYYFICVFKSGKKASLEGDIEEILKSFVITR